MKYLTRFGEKYLKIKPTMYFENVTLFPSSPKLDETLKRQNTIKCHNFWQKQSWHEKKSVISFYFLSSVSPLSLSEYLLNIFVRVFLCQLWVVWQAWENIWKADHDILYHHTNYQFESWTQIHFCLPNRPILHCSSFL